MLINQNEVLHVMPIYAKLKSSILARNHWNHRKRKWITFCLYQVSPLALSDGLSDRTKYPRFYRLCPSDITMVPARVFLMEFFGWTKAALLHQNGNELFSTVRPEVKITGRRKPFSPIATPYQSVAEVNLLPPKYRAHCMRTVHLPESICKWTLYFSKLQHRENPSENYPYSAFWL